MSYGLSVSYVGGITGSFSASSTYNCYNIGEIGGTANYIGNIIGYLNVEQCYGQYVYGLKNTNKNNNLDMVGTYSGTKYLDKQIVGTFDSITSTTFVYDNDKTEPTGYEGDLFCMLNCNKKIKI